MFDRLLKRTKEKKSSDNNSSSSKNNNNNNSSNNIDNSSSINSNNNNDVNKNEVPLPTTPFSDKTTKTNINTTNTNQSINIPDMVVKEKSSKSPKLPHLIGGSLETEGLIRGTRPSLMGSLERDFVLVEGNNNIKNISGNSNLKVPSPIVGRRNTIDNGYMVGQISVGKSPSYEQQLITLSPSLFSTIQSKGFMDDYYETDESLQKYLNTAWNNVLLPKTQTLARIDLKFIVRRGIPDSKRAQIWKLMTGYEELSGTTEFDLISLALNGEGVPKKFRNIPSFGGILSPSDHYLTEEGILQVKRILSITAMNFPEIEYCPVIPDIVHILLIFMSELETYAILNLLIQQSKDNFYRYLNTNNRECTSFLLTFDSLVEIQIPKLYKHMIGLGLTSCSIFAEEWFSRLFVSHLPFQTVLRVFDCYLCEGYKALYRVALGLLMIHKKVLLKATSSEQFLSILKNYNLQMNNSEDLMKKAFSIHLKRRDLLSIDAKQTPKLTNVSEPSLPIYYRPKITTPSSILEEDHYEIIWAWLPHKYCICDPKVIFNSAQDGFNLRLLCEKVENQSPLFIFIKSDNGEVFGFFTDDDLTPSDTFGSSDTFVFSLKPHIGVYKPSKKNELFLKVTAGINRDLWVGTCPRGEHAIHLDRDLNGTTECCETFDSPCLCSTNKFHCAALEAITLIRQEEDVPKLFLAQ